MRIVEYDEVDPIAVLGLNLTGLGYALTPQRVADIRRLDPRPFPCFALYAEIDGIIAGQVGVFGLPVTTTEGEMEVGGLWAVCVDPAFRRQGVASRLSGEAHNRMREAGLRVSTLGTSRHLAAHGLYRQLGYVDGHVAGWTIARLEDIKRPGGLTAARIEGGDLAHADRIYAQLSQGHLGFARRHDGFFQAQVAAGDVSEADLWLIRANGGLVGYVIANERDSLLSVTNVLVHDDVDAAEAVAAVASETKAEFIRVRVDHDRVATSLDRIGFPPVRDQWAVFMVKSLTPTMPEDQAMTLLGLSDDRFLISFLDIT